jgi:hypothetical protein
MLTQVQLLLQAQGALLRPRLQRRQHLQHPA